MSDDAVWVGLDLGLSLANICIVDAAGASILESSCASRIGEVDAVLRPFAERGIAMVAVETGCEAYLTRKLRAHGYPVAIFEARKASKFLAIRASKSDCSDAKGLADLARLGRNTISQVHLKSVECQRLRSLLVMRQRLVRLRVGAENALRSHLAQYGRRLRIASAQSNLRELVGVELDRIKLEENVDLRRDLAPLVDVCARLRAHLNRLDADLAKRAKSHPVCRRLMEVPGVGPICAISFYSAIEDPSRFQRASDVAAYLGLVPRRYQSGDVSRVLGITKNGSKMTRSHLATAALVFLTRAPDCALKEWALRLRDRVGSQKSRVALARKLAILLLTLWKNGSHYEPDAKQRAAVAPVR